VVHKALGKRAARTLVITAAAVNVFMALYLQWAARAPSDPSYPLGAEFSAVLAPLWRITLASIVAEVVSELADTEVYHWFVRRVTTRHQWARVLVSNAVSVPLDNVIFAISAFGALRSSTSRRTGTGAPTSPTPERPSATAQAQALNASSNVAWKPSPSNTVPAGSISSS
jgi:uncharacterized integral membrane protein (TIGR00697 family)